MSGLFKNFERIVSNSVFNNPAHRYLVQFRLACYNPASLFFNKQTLETGLKPGHNYDIFSLALSSYQLLKQTQNYGDILASVSKQSGSNGNFADFQTELETSIARNNAFISQALNDIIIHLKSPTASLPAEAAAGVASVLAETNVLPKDEASKIFSSYLQPIIIEKAEYLSTQNFIDVFVAISKLSVQDAQPLWEALTTAFNKQTLEWEYQVVNYHGWETNVYETPLSNAQNIGDQPESEFFASNTEKYWIDLKNGNAALAQIQRFFRCYWQWEQFNVLFPFFFREKRVNYQFDQRDLPYEKERLFIALKEIEKTYPDKVEVIRQRL